MYSPVPCSWSLCPSYEAPFAHLVNLDILAQARKKFFCQRAVLVLDSEVTIKLGPDINSYEYRVLQMLDRLDLGHCPRPLDYFAIDVSETFTNFRGELQKTQSTWGVIVMTTLPGETLFVKSEKNMNTTHEDRIMVLRDVAEWMDRVNDAIIAGNALFPDSNGVWKPLRIPENKAISDLDEARCLRFPFIDGWFEYRIGVADFVDNMNSIALQKPNSEAFELQQQVLITLCPTDESLRFCHMDLHSGNILALDNEFVGIVDWATAGWYTSTLESYVVCCRLSVSHGVHQIFKDAWDISEAVSSAARMQYRIRQVVQDYSRELRRERAAIDRANGVVRPRRRRRAAGAAIAPLGDVAAESGAGCATYATVLDAESAEKLEHGSVEQSIEADTSSAPLVLSGSAQLGESVALAQDSSIVPP